MRSSPQLVRSRSWARLVEQGVGKIAALIAEDNLVPGFSGRLVCKDESEESANEEHYRLPICKLEFK